MSAVSVIGYDLKREANTTAHHTSDYDVQESSSVVLRRGADFTFEILLSRPFDVTSDFLEIEFARESKAQLNDGSKFLASFNKADRTVGDYSWVGSLQPSDNRLTVTVSIPVNCPIGFYRMTFSTSGGSTVPPEGIVILFNAWNKEDDVYLESAAERDEYVLNQTGLIFRGTAKDPTPLNWNFAQFEEICLHVSLLLVDKKFLSSDARRSPVLVSRTLTEMVNMNDRDNGILWGKWLSQGEDPNIAYGDGTPPGYWADSDAIMYQYVLSNLEPVKYAQCWVFAATLTTALRALGIPARPVTNYVSAHDSEANRTIDLYYDASLNYLSDRSADSVWNYHVWVDAWMTRPDLRGNYGGWQSVDATPQEVSKQSGTMVTGPASVRAVKDGLEMPYDTKFVTSEVNADMLYHMQQEDSSFVVIDSNLTRVGALVATKTIGYFAMNDITNEYKYPEGSLEERVSATQGRPQVDKQHNVNFSIDCANNLEYGHPIVFTVTCKSTSFNTLTVSIIATVQLVNYIGGVGRTVKQFREVRTIETNNEVEVKFTLSPDEYEPFLSSEVKLQCTAYATVQETKQMWLGKATQSFAQAKIQCKFPSGFQYATVGEPFTVTLEFVNPLTVPLTGLKWIIEGSGLVKSQLITDNSIIHPGMVAEKQVELQPLRRAQDHMLTVMCHCKQLEEIYGSVLITIRYIIHPGMVAEKQVELQPLRRAQDHMLSVMCHCKQLEEIYGSTLITVR